MNNKSNENKAIDIMVNKIISMIENKKFNYDKSFPSVVYGINSDGTYTIIKGGQKYNVKCAMSGVDIKLGQGVWVKIPCGRLHEMHIYGLR